MDFLEDLLDFGDKKHRKNGGLFQNQGHHDHDHDDDHDHRPQSPGNSFQQYPANPAAFLPGMVCRHCSTQTVQDARFCHNCGQVIEMIAKCASCGSRISPNAPFCPQCGYRNG